VTLTGVSNSVNSQHYGASLAQASFAAQPQKVEVSFVNTNVGLTGVSNSVNAGPEHDVVNLTAVSNCVKVPYYGASFAQASTAARRPGDEHRNGVDPDSPPDSTCYPSLANSGEASRREPQSLAVPFGRHSDVQHRNGPGFKTL
jgi:hypothetical protein